MRIRSQQDRRTLEYMMNMFPTKLPGAEKIRMHIDSRASYCLVHVKQAHKADFILNLVPKESRDIYKKFLEDMKPKIKDVQHNIVEIVSKIHDNLDLPHVHSEGVRKQDEELFKDIATKDQQTYNSFLSEPKKYMRIYGEKYDYVLHQLEQTCNHSDRLLYIRKGIEIKAGEDSKAYQLALDEINNSKGLQTDKFMALQEDREDGILNYMSYQGIPVGVCIYGAAHDWKDNVERWNRSHYNSRYSLIEIIPEGLLDVVNMLGVDTSTI